MQLTDRVKNCNGCSACVVGCKYVCVKMEERPDETSRKLQPVVNENGCNKCNACVLFCPLFNPVELPEFEKYYEFTEEYEGRDMPHIYRQTMRNVRAGQHTEFIGTLCEIAALKSLLGDKNFSNLIYKPLYCDEEKRAKEACCMECPFYGKEQD